MTRRLLLSALLALALLSGCAPASQAGRQPPAFDTGADPTAWVSVPAGEFRSGPHAERATIDRPYQIMRTPVTNARYASFLGHAAASGSVRVQGQRIVGPYPGDVFRGVRHEQRIDAGDWPHFPLDAPTARVTYSAGAFAVAPGYEQHPATHVTWFGARAYCESTGGSLPTEAQWEKAARGTDGRAYPWGQEIQPGNANYYNSRDPFEAGVGPQGDTTPVGFYGGRTHAGFATLDSPSPHGAYDMAGNVWQWTADVHEGQHYRYLRGGSRADYAYDLRVWTRNSAPPDHSSQNFGFRCARSTAG
jgi:formylglycine-generating enzyme required for sulfatase activity